MTDMWDVQKYAHQAILKACAITGEVWKILIYDDRSQMIIAPVVKVGELRQQGVTLMLHINADRTPVEDVCAIYFVEATEKNLAIILQDISTRKYLAYDFEFVTPMTDLQFANLTTKCSQLLQTLQLDPQTTFKRLVERCPNFVALDSNKFSLEMEDTFSVIYNPKAQDSTILAAVEAVVDGLISFCAAMQIRPLIKIPKNEASPARLVGTRLDEELRKLQVRFGDKFVALSNSGNRRPVLVLTDRTLDFFTPLSHSSTYEALLHDCFGIKLNWIQINENKYELNSSDDEFWRSHQGALYPEVGADTTRLVNEFKGKLEFLNSGTATDTVRNALEMAPHVLAQKKALDMHTIIAQALYEELEKRSIPEFCHLESDLLDNLASSRGVNFQAVRDMLDKGTMEDKQRLICCVYTVSRDQDAKINSLCHLLKTEPTDPALIPALKFLRYQDSLALRSTQPTYDSLKIESSLVSSNQASGLSSSQSGLAGAPSAANFGEFGNKAKGWLYQSFKQLINLKQRPKIVSLIEGLSQQGKISEQYDTLDPLGVPGDVRQTSVNSIIVFVLGGASYIEAEAASRWATENGKNLIIGSTSLLRPCEFLRQINELGGAL